MASQQHIFPFTGGLNLAGITLGLKPGEATLLENYEVLPLGGIRRYDGYERYDGHPQPSLSIYMRLPYDQGSGGVTTGDTITGAISGATGHVLQVVVASGSFAAGDAQGDIILDGYSGTFVATEAIMAHSMIAAYTIAAAHPGSTFDDDYDELGVLSADSARRFIGPVPGEGRVLGVAVFNGLAHAFRNAVGGATACMYVESPTGWVLKKAGLLPNGRYEFRVHNFGGNTATRALYGVSGGVHKAFEWTGSTWTDVTTGMADDRPTHIGIFKNTLLLSFPGGSLQESGVGTPLVWSIRTGAAEIGMGDDITAIESLVGGNLAIYCVDKTSTLSGNPGPSDTNTLSLDELAPDSGAFPYSAQGLPSSTIAVDARGIMPLSATQSYGDFEAASVSQRIQALMDVRADLLVDTLAIRTKSQYRILYSDGVCIAVTFKGAKIVGFSMLRFPVAPTCAGRGKATDRSELLLMGTDDGFVYRLDVGMSFDGVAINATVRTATDSLGSPRQTKHFQNLYLQITSPRPIKLLGQVEFDYELSTADISQYLATDIGVFSGRWNVGRWNQILWSVGDERPNINYPSMRVDGAALTASLILYHGGEIRPPFTIEAGIYIFTVRGFKR